MVSVLALFYGVYLILFRHRFPLAFHFSLPIGLEKRWQGEIFFVCCRPLRQEAGPAARAVDPPELTYVGEGKVVFLLEKEDGSTTNYALTLSIDGEDVHFEAQEENMLLLP